MSLRGVAVVEAALVFKVLALFAILLPVILAVGRQWDADAVAAFITIQQAQRL